MNVKDLGKLDGPVLLFGGPYSNLHAFNALLKGAEKLEISADHAICTGDIVAYCGDPEETTQAVLDYGCVVVAGNCEKQLAEGSDECACGFDESSQCIVLAQDWYAHAQKSVSEASRQWMSNRPDIVIFEHCDRRYAVIHGGVSDISRFIWQVTDEHIFEEEIALLEELVGPVDVVVAGHSGIPFERQIGSHQWINVGAIGMPANDGLPETSYVILKEKHEFHRLCYDSAAAKNKMRGVGLSQGYDEALETGYWPSQDTLPASMRHG